MLKTKFGTELSFKSSLICMAIEPYSLTFPMADCRLGAWLGEDPGPHLPARARPSPWAIIQSQELGDFGLRNPEGFLEEESPELGLEE